MTTLAPVRDRSGETNELFRSCVDVLTQGENHRVWSLIVSFFGDLARAEGDSVSGALLTRFGQLAGVKPEAMRVALHRLRRDGWIESERQGRSSVCRLTRRGREESAAASPKIYAEKGIADSACWSLVIANPDNGLNDGTLEAIRQADIHLAVDERIHLCKGDLADAAAGSICLTGSALFIPFWLKRQLIGEELNEACNHLIATLRRLELLRPNTACLSDLETAVLRTLVVHSWRRVRLRQPDLPDRFFPDDWKGPDCRDLVNTLLGLLPRPSLASLEVEAAGLSKAA